MSDLFNQIIDVAAAAGFRTLELPFVVLMLLAIVPVGIAWGVVRWWTRRGPPAAGGKIPGARAFALVYLVLVAALLIDVRMATILLEVRELRAELGRLANRPVPATPIVVPTPEVESSATEPPAVVELSSPEPAESVEPPGETISPVHRPPREAPVAHRPNSAAQPPPGKSRQIPSLPHSAIGPATVVDETVTRAAVEKLFPSAELIVRGEADGVDYLWLRFRDPHEAIAHVAVIDLTNPGVEIAITKEKGNKWKTSEFARQHECAVAVNGEAGVSNAEDCELGEWKGNWVVEGEAVMMADSNRRPFLSFDAQNRARYSRALNVDHELTEWKWNTLWGRGDLLIGGRVMARNRSVTPRNCMAIDAAGETLYLLVVDGRKPGYSRGLSLDVCGKLLLALGASDAMSCDQGGSACMYLASRGGIASRPSDFRGERPVYTHFGVAVRE